MPKLRTLSGSDVVTILSLFGFEKVDQRGSHSVPNIKRVGMENARSAHPVPAGIIFGRIKASTKQVTFA
jgi:hypothetical protein